MATKSLINLVEDEYTGAELYHAPSVPKPSLPESQSITTEAIHKLGKQLRGRAFGIPVDVHTQRPKQVALPTVDIDPLDTLPQFDVQTIEKPRVRDYEPIDRLPIAPSSIATIDTELEMVPRTKSPGVTEESLLSSAIRGVPAGIVSAGATALRATRLGKEGRFDEEIEALERTAVELAPKSGMAREILHSGVSSFVQSTSLRLPGAVAGGTLGALVGGPAGLAKGAMGGAMIGPSIMFGMAEYDRVISEARKQGLPIDDKVKKYALLSGLVEGGVELASDAILFSIFNLLGLSAKGAIKPTTDIMKSTLKGILRKTYGASLRDFGKNYLKAVPVEVGEELIQDISENYFRQKAGIDVERYGGEDVLKTIGATAISTLLFGLSSGIINRKKADAMAKALANPDASPEARMNAAEVLKSVALARSKYLQDIGQVEDAQFMRDVASTWDILIRDRIQNKLPVNIDADVTKTMEDFVSYLEERGVFPRGQDAQTERQSIIENLNLPEDDLQLVTEEPEEHRPKTKRRKITKSAQPTELPSKFKKRDEKETEPEDTTESTTPTGVLPVEAKDEETEAESKITVPDHIKADTPLPEEADQEAVINAHVQDFERSFIKLPNPNVRREYIKRLREDLKNRTMSEAERKGIERFLENIYPLPITQRTIKGIKRNIKEQGGATYIIDTDDLTTLNKLPYVVSLRSINIPIKSSLGEIEYTLHKLLAKNKDLIDGLGGHGYINLGVFKMDDKQFSVDLNIATDNRDFAIEVGKATGQRSIWNGYENDAVPTGYDGPYIHVPTPQLLELLKKGRIMSVEELKAMNRAEERVPATDDSYIMAIRLASRAPKDNRIQVSPEFAGTSVHAGKEKERFEREGIKEISLYIHDSPAQFEMHRFNNRYVYIAKIPRKSLWDADKQGFLPPNKELIDKGYDGYIVRGQVRYFKPLEMEYIGRINVPKSDINKVTGQNYMEYIEAGDHIKDFPTEIRKIGPLTHEIITRLSDSFRKSFAPGLQLRVFRDINEALTEYPRETFKNVNDDDLGRIGAYTLYDEKSDTYTWIIISNNIKDYAHLDQVLWEEATHVGLHRILGERFNWWMEKNYDRLPDDKLRHIENVYGLDKTSRQDRIIAAAEVVARMAAMGERPDFIQKLNNEVRLFMRMHFGFQMELTDQEIRTIVDNAKTMLLVDREKNRHRNLPPTDGGAHLVNSYRIVESNTYKGIRMTSMMDANDIQLVAQDSKGNDIGRILVKVTPDGFYVRRIDSAKPGTGTELVLEAYRRYGKILGASALTEKGRKFFTKLFHSYPSIFGDFDPEMFEDSPPIEPGWASLVNVHSMSDAIREWTKYYRAYKARNTALATQLPKDMGVMEAIYSLPHWVAMEFPEARPVIDIQWDRIEKRNADRIYLTQDDNTGEVNDYLKLKDTSRVDKLIVWSDENNVYLRNDNDIQNRARALGLGTLSNDEIKAYHAWKDAMDKAILYIENKLKRLSYMLYKHERWWVDFDDYFLGIMTVQDIINKYSLTPDEIKRLQKQIQNLTERHQKIDDLVNQLRSREFYMPRHRGRGPYVVEVRDMSGARPVLVYFNRHETLTEAEHERQELLSIYQAPRYEITKDKRELVSEDVYSEVTSSATIDFIKHSLERGVRRGDISQPHADAMLDQFSEYIQDMVFARGGMSFRIPRVRERVIKGYQTENLKEVMMVYLSGLSGSANKLEAATLFQKELSNIDSSRQRRLYEYLLRYTEDMLRNTDRVDRIIAKFKFIPYMWYLGGVARMGLAQISQNFLTAYPALHREAKLLGLDVSASKEITKAMKDIATGKLTLEEKMILDIAIKQGNVRAQLWEEIKAQISGKPIGRALQIVQDYAFKMFAGVESFNRQVALIAMFRVAKAGGLNTEQAFNEAKRFVRSTHFAYGLSNMPQILRDGTTLSKIGASAYTLRTFMHNLLLFWKYYSRTPDGKLSLDVLGRSLAVMAIVGGLSGMPFLDDLLDLLERARGIKFRANMTKLLRGIGGEMLVRVGWSGLPALIGIDISGTVALNIPFVGEDVREALFGVWAGLMDKGTKAISYLLNGEYMRAIESASPSALEAILKARRIHKEGITTYAGRAILDESGRPLYPTPYETALQAGSFRPARISAIQKERRILQNLEGYYREKKTDLTRKLRLARTPEERREVLEEIKELNQKILKHPEIATPLRLTGQIMRPEREYMKYRIRTGQRRESAIPVQEEGEE